MLNWDGRDFQHEEGVLYSYSCCYNLFNQLLTKRIKFKKTNIGKIEYLNFFSQGNLKETK